LKTLSIEELLAELEFPFPIDHVFWLLADTPDTFFRSRNQICP